MGVPADLMDKRICPAAGGGTHTQTRRQRTTSIGHHQSKKIKSQPHVPEGVRREMMTRRMMPDPSIAVPRCKKPPWESAENSSAPALVLDSLLSDALSPSKRDHDPREEPRIRALRDIP